MQTPLRTFVTQLFIVVLAVAHLEACDGVDVGRSADPDSAPLLVRIMFQDEDREAGRGVATDLLSNQPVRTCSETNPCAAGRPPCAIPVGMSEGICPDPFNAVETPPAIGTPIVFGGNQIRLVFNQLLEASLDEKLMAEGSAIVRLLDAGGQEVPTSKYFDPTGSPTITSDVISAPFGPAIVMKNVRPLSAGTRYVIRLDASAIKDRKGKTPISDINGPIQQTYTLTTESLYALALTPDFVMDPEVEIATDDYLVVETNADFDEKTVSSTTVVVRDETGARVEVEAFADRGPDPADCDGMKNNRQLDIVPVSAPGIPIAWSPGTYTVAIEISGDNGATTLRADAQGTPLEGGFIVTEEAAATNAIDDLVLPELCEDE